MAQNKHSQSLNQSTETQPLSDSEVTENTVQEENTVSEETEVTIEPEKKEPSELDEIKAQLEELKKFKEEALKKKEEPKTTRKLSKEEREAIKAEIKRENFIESLPAEHKEFLEAEGFDLEDTPLKTLKAFSKALGKVEAKAEPKTPTKDKSFNPKSPRIPQKSRKKEDIIARLAKEIN